MSDKATEQPKAVIQNQVQEVALDQQKHEAGTDDSAKETEHRQIEYSRHAQNDDETGEIAAVDQDLGL